MGTVNLYCGMDSTVLLLSLETEAREPCIAYNKPRKISVLELYAVSRVNTLSLKNNLNKLETDEY
jgi:hypothetical protein